MKWNGAIENLLARRNKKQPFDDGRKIVLLHPGGVMAGVQGCGALAALQSFGLTDAFDEVYAISAGFPNAAYFLAEQSEISISVYCDALSGKKFINPFKFWRMEDVNYLLDVFEDSGKKLAYERITECQTKLFVFVKNIDTGHIECLQAPKSDRKFFFSLLRASVSMPLLSPRSVEVGSSQYRDVFFNFEKQRQLLFKKVPPLSEPTDIVAIYNYPITCPMEAGKVNVAEIAPQDEHGSMKYETDGGILRAAAEDMRRLTTSIFKGATRM